MTEAVAGMTAWALATRGGGGEKVEGPCRVRAEGTGGTAPLQVAVTVS